MRSFRKPANPGPEGTRRCEWRVRRVATWAAALSTLLTARRADAQQDAQGFAVERLYPSAPGGGWVVMDALDMRGRLGGVMGLSIGYAHHPLQIRSQDGSQHIVPVADEVFADFGLGVTHDRFRVYVNMDMPLAAGGQKNTIGAFSFVPPSIDLGNHPDTVSDARLGADARLFGSAKSPFRLGVGAQLIFPNGNRADYDTDGTYRGMGRLLLAGDAGAFAFAGQLGVHVRPLDDSRVPGSPRGSELLFGIAGGPKLAAGSSMVVVIGPEIFGQTAFNSFFGAAGTGVEGLLTGRIEGTRDEGAQIRIKCGVGAGIYARFGAPEWRVLFGVEVVDHATLRRERGP